MTKKEVERVIADVPPENRGKVVCALIGHSRIVTACFGYIHCGRCDEQVADKLGGYGYSEAKNCVQIGHDCQTCHENYAKMSWRDKWLSPDPFAKEKAHCKEND